MAGRRFAVLVANATFGDDQPQLRKLRCPSNDLAGMEAVLSSEEHGGYVVTSLLDGTHDAARRAIYQCLKKAGSEDLVLIYFSGHGKLDEDGNLYLVTKDTIVDELPPTSIPVDDIKRYLAESAAARKVVILDCCFSGAIKKMYKGEVADQASQAIRDFEGQGTFYLTASTDIQLAEEKESDEYSLLTKYIITGIKDGKADANDDGRISFNELCSYIQTHVPKEGSQKPKAWYLEAEGDITLALTGKPAGDARRKAIILKLYELASQDLLTDDVVAALLQIIQRRPAERLGSGRTVKELTDSLYSKLGNVGQFLQEVVRCTESPVGAPTTQRSLPLRPVSVSPANKVSADSVSPASTRARHPESAIPSKERSTGIPLGGRSVAGLHKDDAVKPPVQRSDQQPVTASTTPALSAPPGMPQIETGTPNRRWLLPSILAVAIIVLVVIGAVMSGHRGLSPRGESSVQEQPSTLQAIPKTTTQDGPQVSPPKESSARDNGKETSPGNEKFSGREASAVKEIPKPDFGVHDPVKVTQPRVRPTSDRVHVSSGVASSLLLQKVNPAYPPLARQARIQGTVTLQAVIAKDGTVEDLQLVIGHPLLAPAAIDAVKEWRYKPYVLNGEPVKVETQIVVNFTLDHLN